MSQIKVEYINHCGDDLSVVDAARCSFDKMSQWEGIENESYILSKADTKLINYLANHKHFSPFNHSFISVRVKAPVFVARQLVKHKFMPWNEVSRRYVKGEVELYTPDSWRKAAENVKQGSSSEIVEKISCLKFDKEKRHDVYEAYEAVTEEALNLYNSMIESGICAEEARMVLPQSMMTTWIWSGTLGAFCDMLKLRLDSHTQYETRIVAQEVAKIVKELFPVSYEALVGVE